MKTKTAYKIIAEAVQKEMQRFAFDANLFEKGLATYPSAQRAHARRKKLQDALEVVREVLIADQPSRDQGVPSSTRVWSRDG